MFKQIVIDHIHEILWVCLIMLHVFYLISAPFWAFPGVRRNAMIRNMFFLIMKLLDCLGIGIPLERSLGLGSGFGLDSSTLMASCVTPSRRTLGEIRLVNYGWCHSWYDHSHGLKSELQVNVRTHNNKPYSYSSNHVQTMSKEYNCWIILLNWNDTHMRRDGKQWFWLWYTYTKPTNLDAWP